MRSDVMKIIILFTWSCQKSLQQHNRKALATEDEVRLVEHVFNELGYNELIRPVRNLNETMVVSFEVALIQLINIEEKSQIMKTNVWLRMGWKDYQLTWAKQNFGNIDIIRVPAAKVWKPDVVLFNNADGKYEVSWQPNVLVKHDGDIMWIPPAIYKSSCTIHVKYFPFDQQECLMIFGSWTFDATQVRFKFYSPKKTDIDLIDYWKSGTWDIVRCPGEIRNATRKGLPPETRFVYTLVLRRKTLFFTVNLIIPCVLIAFLSVAVFYLPADAGEKITLSISILLALVVFLLLISKILPPTSMSIPLISTYLLFTFIMNIITILVTVIIINLNYRTPRTHKMPNFIKLVFMDFFPRILFLKRPTHIEKSRLLKRALDEASRVKAANNSSRCNGDVGVDHFEHSRGDVDPSALAMRLLQHPQEHHPNCHMSMHHLPETAPTSRQQDRMPGMPDMRQQHEQTPRTRQRHADPNHLHTERLGCEWGNMEITPAMRSSIGAINFISSHLRMEDEYSRVLLDWKYVASVIDRIILYIFTIVTLAGTIGIFIDAPYLFEYVDQDAIIEANKLKGP